MDAVMFALAGVVLTLWTVAIARIVERRCQRRIHDVQVEVDVLFSSFTRRWDALDRAVHDGLKELERQQPERVALTDDPKQLLVARAIAVCSDADAVVMTYADCKGYAVKAKVGSC